MIRRAKGSDKSDVVRMSLQFAKEAGTPVAVDPRHVSRVALEFLASPRCLCLIIGDRRAQGIFVATIQTSMFSEAKFGQEVIFWIEPSARGGSGARLALLEYERWATEQGAQYISMINRAGSRAGVLYRRQGYHLSEEIMMKVI